MGVSKKLTVSKYDVSTGSICKVGCKRHVNLHLNTYGDSGVVAGFLMIFTRDRYTLCIMAGISGSSFPTLAQYEYKFVVSNTSMIIMYLIWFDLYCMALALVNINQIHHSYTCYHYNMLDYRKLQKSSKQNFSTHNFITWKLYNLRNTFAAHIYFTIYATHLMIIISFQVFHLIFSFQKVPCNQLPSWYKKIDIVIYSLYIAYFTLYFRGSPIRLS